MRKSVDDLALLGLVAIALIFSLMRGALAEDYGCDGCSRMSSSEFRLALDKLKTTSQLRVDVFAFFMVNRPYALPLRAIEGGAKCTIADRDEVANVVRLVSALEISQVERMSVESVVELRFYRSDDTEAKRPVLEAFFDMASTRGDVAGGLATSVVINGKLAMTYKKEVQKILDYAGDVTRSPGNRVCEAFKQFNNR